VERKIRIFKSFEEQETFHLEQMRNTTPFERFRRLYSMQQLNRRFHPATDTARKIIIIRNGRSE